MATWQSILTYATSGTIGIALLLAGIFSLTGISEKHSGDIICTDCFSQINVSSSYWEIKITWTNSTQVVFRNSTARTVWVNLYKVDEVVSTDPAIHVDLLIPATKSTADVKSDEYGYLREL